MKKKEGFNEKPLMVIPLTFLLCFTSICQDKEALAELEAMKAQAEIEELYLSIIPLFFLFFSC